MRGRCKAIAVNSSVFSAPWAAVLYAADAEWWRYYARVLTFSGLCVAAEQGAARYVPAVRTVTVLREQNTCSPRMQFDALGVLGGGSNSGAQAINLAVQFGARRVVLLGFDMQRRRDGTLHHHGAHPAPLRNPQARLFEKWIAALDSQAPILKARGVDIANASPESALKGFCKRSVSEALALWS